MRIVLCPSAFHPSVGGVEEHCRHLAEYLCKNGHEVRIAVNRHPRTLSKTEHFGNVIVERFDFASPSRSSRAITVLPVMLATVWSFLHSLRTNRANVLHIVCPSSNSFYGYIAASVLGIPCVTSFHGELFMDANRLYQKSAFARWSLRKLLGVSNAVTACSQFVLDDAKSKFELPPVQAVIFNGIDAIENHSAVEFDLANKQYILGVGRLVPQKGFDMLLKSFAPIAQKFPNLHLVIAGDGPERETLMNLATKQGLATQVIFTGSANRKQVDAIFEHCLFFVLTSPAEPFGIVCLEAMRSGKPVIAFNTGGPPEFITDGIEGILVKPSSVPDLTNAMQQLLDDEQRRRTMGDAARNRAEKYSWDAAGDRFQQIYEQVVKQQR